MDREYVAPTYKAVVAAWNGHVHGGVDWRALVALVVGALLALGLALVFPPVFKYVAHQWNRMAVQLQCCIVIHVAPEVLPIIRTNTNQRKSHMRQSQQRATPQQWNAMRMKLGPNVPDQSIEDLVKNYGDDVNEAAAAFYGDGYSGM